MGSALLYFSTNPDSSDSRHCSRLSLPLAMIPPHRCYSMLFGLPVCYAPESAETLSKRWIIRPSRSNTEAYLMFTRYQRGRQIPTSKSSAVTLEFTIEAVVVQGKKWNENRFLYLAKMRKDYVLVKFYSSILRRAASFLCRARSRTEVAGLWDCARRMARRGHGDGRPRH